MTSEEDEEEVEQSENNEGKSGTEWRNWADLPRDTLFIIFKRIAAAEILSSVQFVCRPWRQVSHEPALWRCVDLRYNGINVKLSMAMIAVDRSKGCMEELHIQHIPIDKLMPYIAERATGLLRLHLSTVSMDHISVFLNGDKLAQTLRKLPLLEELQISQCECFSYKVVEQIGPAAPQLKSFRLDDQMNTFLVNRWSDAHRNFTALAIAKRFKQLRRLQLFANCLTSIGLSAILDNCPDLEYLDIRYCFNVGSLDESLKNKCARLKDFRLPNDSIVDYEYSVDLTALEFLRL